MFVRSEYQVVMSRLEEPRQFIQVLAGPRQVGKTTLVSQVLANLSIPHASHSADDEPNVTQGWLTDVWETQRNIMDARGERERVLVIDEIQKIDNWSETVKKEWDRDTREGRNLKVLLLGSSRLLLKKGLTESLAGRFEMIRMGHWDFNEMRDAFGWTLDQYIYFGGYPGAASIADNETRWKRYVRDALVESAVGSHLVNHAEKVGYKVFYWREKADEVDFIVQRGSTVHAIEVKSGRRTTNAGLALFRKAFNGCRSMVVGSGGIPVGDFLAADMDAFFS